MLPSTFTLVAAFLPLLALTTATPHAPNAAHGRHRRLSNAVRQAAEHDEAPRAAVAPRDNYGHSQVKKLIKRSVKKRGQTCRPRGGKNTFLSSAAPASVVSSSIAVSSAATATATSASSVDQDWDSSSSSAEWTASSTTEAAWTTTSSSVWQAPTTSASSAGGGYSNARGLLEMNDAVCGWSDANDDSPNGAENWLNCGLNGGGWTPPHVTVDQLIGAELTANGVFAPCADYIDKFNQYAEQYGMKGIMLASFAMQESTCRPWVTGGNGEAGLMQLTHENCGGAPGGNCYDIDFNIQRAAELFSNLIDSNGGNVLLAIGSYNGWTNGLTIGQATAAASQGRCQAQNNLDYIHQYCNGWMQGKSGYDLGSYFNLRQC